MSIHLESFLLRDHLINLSRNLCAPRSLHKNSSWHPSALRSLHKLILNLFLFRDHITNSSRIFLCQRIIFKSPRNLMAQKSILLGEVQKVFHLFDSKRFFLLNNSDGYFFMMIISLSQKSAPFLHTSPKRKHPISYVTVSILHVP